MLTDDYYMRAALREAARAFEDDEVPIGAVVACGGQIIGKGHNQTERLQDPTAHAEMIAITAACNFMGSKYLPECELYVTVEPCVMCAGASRWAQVSRIIVGAPEPKTGFSRLGNGIIHPKTLITTGILEEECVALMQEFFRKKRK
ncbi:MAG: nucleoside deaminase [Bacteroidia bacterium]